MQAKKHVLVISRTDCLDSLADVKKEHLSLLRSMHSVGLKWAQKFLEEDASLTLRLGYHSVLSYSVLNCLFPLVYDGMIKEQILSVLVSAGSIHATVAPSCYKSRFQLSQLEEQEALEFLHHRVLP
jgi:hypothetical protein